MAQSFQMLDIYKMFIGRIINSAIQDYESNCLKENRNRLWEEAKDFLFNKPRLEEFLEKYGLEGEVNCAILRRRILNHEIEVVDEIS